MGNTTFCTSLAGDELGRIPSWGTDTRRHADYELQSPCTMLDAPQTITEPVMMQAAQARGAKVRFDTEYLSHVQDEDGVTTTVRDRLTGATYTIRSKYLVGADGAPQQGRRRPRPAVRGPRGRRRRARHHLRGRPDAGSSRTARRSCTGWCSRARRRRASGSACCG